MADSDWSPPEGDFKTADWSPPESDFAPVTQSPPETAGRIAGLGARGLATGAAGLPDAVMSLDPIGSAVSAASHAVGQKLGIEGAPSEPGQKPTLSDFVHPEKWQQAAEYFATKTGLPNPETPAERIGYRAAQALPSAALAPETPILGGLSAAAGGAGSQGAAEAGAGPVGQAAAGIVAGGVPAIGAGLAAGARGIVRGGAEGQAAMKSRLADAAASGDTDLSVGQASGNTGLQYLEGAQRALPGSGPLKKLPSTQGTTLGSHVEGIIDNLSGADVPSPTTAGSAINVGADVTKQNMRAAERAAFAQRDALVPPTTPTDVSGTIEMLNEHGAPIEGAEAIKSVVPEKISTLRDEVMSAANQNPASAGGAPILPYKAVSALKNRVGQMVHWGFAPDDPQTNGALKQVYGALGDDLNTTASAVSPEAATASKSANALYAANSDRRDFLNGIINQNGGPENVYQAATNGTKLGATKISGVMSALQPDQQNIVRATVLDKMGRATGAQDAPFNANTFLTNWTNIDRDAKDALFGAGGAPGTLRSGLDSVTNTIGNIREGTKLQNWAGTGEKVGHSAGLLAAWEGIKALMAGNSHVLMGTAAGVAANNILARSLTNPRVVNWLAQSTKAPVSALPSAVNQLSQMNDPDAHALATYLQQPAQSAIARASGGKVDIDVLVNRLIKRWKDAKKQTDASTKPLLRQPDSIIVRALNIAQEHI